MTARGAPLRHGDVAAHSPETAGAGLQILQSGGTAADAAAAMTLAACVVEPLVVSLLSGMHAIHVQASGRTSAIDGFVDVPATTTGGRTAETTVVFAAEEVPYTVGGATFGTPGLVAGCAALVADHGRLPWDEVVAPARALASEGFIMGTEDEVLLAMLEPVMTLHTGGAVFCNPDGSLKRAGDRVVLPDVGSLLAQLATEGPATLYDGALAEDLARFCAEVGALVTAADLAAFTPHRHTPPAVRVGGHVIRARRGLSPLLDWLDHLGRRGTAEPAAVRLAAAQQPDVRGAHGTTSLAVMDAWGNACAVTASLGLGTGDWFSGQQLNSMLGESDLLRGPLRPRTRMGSMMAPTAVLDASGVRAVLGAAGGSRIPSAVLRVVDGLVNEQLTEVQAVDLPRVHRMGRTVHVEPHLPDADEAALVAAGWQVIRWSTRHHYFGGVSVAGRGGSEGDPRRGGVARQHRLATA
ncbi:MAG TPA: gamma-glutamyltransferase [Euzebya sp.]|nr:gamma-glutamyltransferase [Euzebya sp.]